MHRLHHFTGNNINDGSTITHIDQTVTAAGKWLLKQQDRASGGWADRPGGHVNALNTAEAVISLIDGDICQAGEKPIKDAIVFLQKHQIKNGQDHGCWPREVILEDGNTISVPDLARTTFAIQALYRSGIAANESPTKEALAWLFQVRNSASYGWGYRRNSPSEFTPSCFALITLLETYKACSDSCQQKTRESLEWFVNTFFNEGGSEVRGSFGPSGPLCGVHTIYGAIAIQIARLKGLSTYQTQENQAIEWLLSHPDAAIRQREEWMQIDTATNATNQSANYGFMFMTDTLLIRLLMGSINKTDRNSNLARIAMFNLRDNVDENSGAIYGSRVYSWSTAQAVSALSVWQKHAGSEIPDFPKLAPEYKGHKVGPVIVSFAVLLSAFGFYLANAGKFDLLSFSFFSILMLAALVAYGTIGDKTFKELFGKLVGTAIKIDKPEVP